MAAVKKHAELLAVETVYDALKDLDADTRSKVIASVFALLGIVAPPPSGSSSAAPPTVTAQRITPSVSSGGSRPTSIIELLQEKNPSSNWERIAVFAYYRERYEGQARFAREDLEKYFASARLTPAGNFGRDFTAAVTRGWIHEDGADSYLTSKGLEAVESGFEKQGSARPRKPIKKAKAKKKKR